MKLSPDQKAGLLITAIIHLAVIIILLLVRIGYEVERENSFVLDFTKQEEQERVQQQEDLRLAAARSLDELLAATAGIPIRNVTVNRSQLRDDRGTNAEELYRDAERLARDLQQGQQLQEPDDGFVSAAEPSPVVTPQAQDRSYSGPSVLSWSLDGRRASHLPIPAYRCMGAGEVTVIIGVNNQGTVVAVRIDDNSSSQDECLRTYAVRAARLSRFSASPTAPSRQAGTITYLFIAQ